MGRPANCADSTAPVSARITTNAKASDGKPLADSAFVTPSGKASEASGVVASVAGDEVVGSEATRVTEQPESTQAVPINANANVCAASARSAASDLTKISGRWA